MYTAQLTRKRSEVPRENVVFFFFYLLSFCFYGLFYKLIFRSTKILYMYLYSFYQFNFQLYNFSQSNVMSFQTRNGKTKKCTFVYLSCLITTISWRKTCALIRNFSSNFLSSLLLSKAQKRLKFDLKVKTTQYFNFQLKFIIYKNSISLYSQMFYQFR